MATRQSGAVASGGVYWTPAHEDAGSRQDGWEVVRPRLKNVMKPDGPRLFVFNTCRQFIWTVPVLPRDEIDVDDVDNAADEAEGRPSGEEKETGFAAAPGVAFPAELLAAARGVAFMTEYLKVKVQGEQRRGQRGRTHRRRWMAVERRLLSLPARPRVNRQSCVPLAGG